MWKTVADPFAGRITLFRVLTGSLKSDATVTNLTKETPERLGHLMLMQGKTQTQVPEIKAGDIGAVAKLKETVTNDLLGDKDAAFTLTGASTSPKPVMLVRDRAEEPRRRREDQHGDAPAAGRGSDDQTTRATRRPKSCSSPGRDSSTSRSRSPS